MPSLSLKKLFKSKKDAASDNNNTKPEKSRSKQTSGTKARIASFTSTFRRRTNLQSHATIEPRSGAVFQSQISDVIPLPPIPRVASTLRRDLGHFKPLPPIYANESDDPSGSNSFIDDTNIASVATPTPLATYTIRRKPVSSGYASNDRRTTSESPLAKSIIRRKPVPVTKVVRNSSFCTELLEENGIAPTAEGASAIDCISRAGFIPIKQDSPSALITARDAAASRPHSNPLNSSPSRTISLSEFPLPPVLPRIQQTSPPTLYRACTSVQIARQAAYGAPTAIDAQQALIDLADVSATNGTTTNNADTIINCGRGSSGETMLATSLPRDQGERDSIENASTASTSTINGSRLGYVTRDVRRQNQIIRALQSEKAKAVTENQVLSENLTGANTMVRVERAKQAQFRRQFEEAHDAHSRIYNSKLRLAEERDIARSMAEESAAAAKISEDQNKELFGKVASREYVVCQAKIVLENHENFRLRTGHTPEEWHQRAVSLFQAHLELGSRHESCEANIGKLSAQLSETASALNEVTEALQKSETEAWTSRHLYEESGRALELSQDMHKQSSELVEVLQKETAKQELTSEIEKTCSVRQLADAMRQNAAKDKRIACLHDSLSILPGKEQQLGELLDLAKLQLSDSEQKTILAQRSAEDAFELLATEEMKSGDLLQEKVVLEDKIGQLQLELDVSSDEKLGVQKELSEVHRDLDVAGDNARLWQTVVEQRLDELVPEGQAEMKTRVLQELRKQLEQAEQCAEYYKQKSQTVREDAADLEYDLHLHERRLANDAGQELIFYQTHWEKVEWVFDENRELKARLEAFEQRFAAELETEPLQLTWDPHAHKSFDEAVGPEFVAQSIALVKGRWGSHDPSKPCLTEKVQGIYGFGPAGPPSGRKSVEMPEGYLERKSTRQGMEVQGQCEDEWEDTEEYVMSKCEACSLSLARFAPDSSTLGIIYGFS